MGHPTYMYRRHESGEIEGAVFDSDELPNGWVDSPAKVDDETKVEKPRKGKKT